MGKEINNVFADKNASTDEFLIIHEVLVAEGDSVTKGDVLFVAEGSKALFDIEAPVSGIVTEVRISAGSQVDIGSILLAIEEL
jgi:biotin carboxyl carrier protein